VGNDPINKTDPTGQWALLDDAIAIGGGALIGVAALGVHDLITGQLSSGESYAGAAVGGAVTGEAALYAPVTLPALAAVGAAGGLAQNVTTQALSIHDGKQAEFSTQKAVASTAIGAVAGPLGNKIGEKLLPATPTLGSLIAAEQKSIGVNIQSNGMSTALGSTTTSLGTTVGIKSSDTAIGAASNVAEDGAHNEVDKHNKTGNW
jgi:hypothetical protein